MQNWSSKTALPYILIHRGTDCYCYHDNPLLLLTCRVIIFLSRACIHNSNQSHWMQTYCNHSAATQWTSYVATQARPWFFPNFVSKQSQNPTPTCTNGLWYSTTMLQDIPHTCEPQEDEPEIDIGVEIRLRADSTEEREEIKEVVTTLWALFINPSSFVLVLCLHVNLCVWRSLPNTLILSGYS